MFSTPSFRAAALTAILAFGTGAAILSATNHDVPAASAREPAPALPSRDASTDERIAAYDAIVKARPRVPAGYALLSAAYQQKSRESADPDALPRAERAVERGLRVAPADLSLLAQRSSLRLARHQFKAALVDAEAVYRADPTLRRPYGALVDALVELGQYGRAGERLQEAIDRGPTLGIYARASYFRELHGDIAGAKHALRLAASAGGESAENVSYVQTLLGNLQLGSGDPRGAERSYREALGRTPAYVPALIGFGRLAASRGDLGDAERRLSDAVGRNASPESLTALVEVQLAAKSPGAASSVAELRDTYASLSAEGENTGVERGLFEAQHGSPALALQLARQGLRDAPSVRAEDALAYALTRSGRPGEALRHARRAVRLGSRDAGLLYRSAVTANAAGEPELARRWIHRALASNPRFSPLYAPQARQLERVLRSRS